MQHRRRIAIALISSAIVLLQIGVTRILSVVLWYHWAFFAISLAMLGLGAPGVWFAVRPMGAKVLRRLLLSAAVLIPPSVVALVALNQLFGSWAIVFCMLCLLPVFLSLGGAVCILLLEQEDVGKMYAWDLFGACVGAVLVVPAMTVFATPSLVAALAVLPLAALLCLPSATSRDRQASLAVAVMVGVSFLGGDLYTIGKTKSYREEGRLKPTLVRWTPTARLAVFPEIPWSPDAAFGWGVGSKATAAPKNMPKQMWLEQDASAGTPITAFDGDLSRLDYLFYDVTSAAYSWRKPASVAIVGTGGGRDILTALASGAKQVKAIELNGGIVDILTGPLKEFSGDVYGLPAVSTVVGDGRSVLTRSTARFDMIQISMIDSWAATAAGAYSLSENNLYTVEAYKLYLSRLKPRGLLSTSRWMGPQMGYEIMRLMILVKAALRESGSKSPDSQMVLLGAGKVASLIVARQPFTGSELERLRSLSQQRGFNLLYPSPHPLLKLVLEKEHRYFEPAGLDMRPPRDDRPFFFQVLSPLRSIPAQSKTLGINAQAVKTLRTLMLSMALVSLLLFFAPFLFKKKIRQQEGFWWGSLFFSAIGIAFMLLEVSWLQRFVRYLGHPSFAAAATLGYMLLGAGLGAWLSSRIPMATAKRWAFVVGCVTAALTAMQPSVFDWTIGFGLAVRLAVAGAFVLPAGLVMGAMFPLGMRAFAGPSRAWFWALNGCAGVLASVGSLAFALEYGFAAVGFTASGIYGAAWFALRQSK